MALGLPPLTRSDKRKLAWGLGGAAAIALGISYLTKKKTPEKKPDYGIRVNALCSEWTVTDPTRLQLAREEVWNQFIRTGVSDPWVITNAIIGKIASHCRRPTAQRRPGEMRNPGEAIFYYSAFIDTLCYLIDRNILTPASAIADAREAQGWAIEQGVNPSDPNLADPACATGGAGGGGGGGGTGGAPAWLQCTPPTVPLNIQGEWECLCPNGQPPQLVEQNGMMVPLC